MSSFSSPVRQEGSDGWLIKANFVRSNDWRRVLRCANDCGL